MKPLPFWRLYAVIEHEIPVQPPKRSQENRA
jgi:hypothetical protein